MSTKKVKLEKPCPFFWKEVSLDDDIKRHRDEENSIREKLKELELIPIRTQFEERARNVYAGFLYKLTQSKELVANKIGRSK